MVTYRKEVLNFQLRIQIRSGIYRKAEQAMNRLRGWGKKENFRQGEKSIYRNLEKDHKKSSVQSTQILGRSSGQKCRQSLDMWGFVNICLFVFSQMEKEPLKSFQAQKGLGMCFKIMTLAAFWRLGWRKITLETMSPCQEGHFQRSLHK